MVKPKLIIPFLVETGNTYNTAITVFSKGVRDPKKNEVRLAIIDSPAR